jgi:hypothetical protein
MILAVILSIILLGMAAALRKTMDETIWHEANMFVTKEGELLIFE